CSSDLPGPSATLENCPCPNNSAQAGAGVYIHQSSLNILGGSISGNTLFDGAGAMTGGGVQLNGGTPTFDGLTIANNTGADEGGGIYVEAGTLNGHALSIQNNGASNAAGNVRLAAGAIVLRACE